MEMTEPKLVGGSAEDQAQILQLHGDYLDANTNFDWPKVEKLYSGTPEAVYFNLNGHTYYGREHWINLWKYYGQNVQSTYWTPFDIKGVVNDGMAVVWCHRKTRRRWTGSEPPPREINYNDSEFTTRSTMVFRREDDGVWRVVHAHFSKEEETPRPGGV
jgi:ketosteroid isomerase-like protein